MKKCLLYIFCAWLPCVRTEWICDDSQGFSVNGSTVTHSASNHDSVHNCMWVEGEGVSSGEHYWKINFQTLEWRGGVCITSKECFKTGYATKGLCYHGFLSDNSIFLVGNFGPHPTEGDTIGVLASFEDDRLKVYFDINGEGLGLAFDIPASIFNPVYVAVHFHESGSATCEKEREIPFIKQRFPMMFSNIVGDWILKNITDNGITSSISSVSLFEHPTSRFERVLGENKDNEVFKWYVRGLPDTMISFLSKNYGKWVTSNIRSGYKNSPSAQRKFKQKISDLMKMVKTVNVGADGRLYIESDNVTTMWERYDDTPDPFILINLPSEYAQCQIYYN